MGPSAQSYVGIELHWIQSFVKLRTRRPRLEDNLKLQVAKRRHFLFTAVGYEFEFLIKAGRPAKP